MRLLVFNLVTDADDPTLGFTTQWLCALAKQAEFIQVITMHAGLLQVPGNVSVLSVGKEKGYSEPRRAVLFYRHLRAVLSKQRFDVAFSHMIPLFTVMAGPLLKARGIPIVTWYAHRAVTPILKLAHHLSDRMVSASDGSYRYHHDKFVALGHGIDTDVFAPTNCAPDEPALLLSVGRLSPIKGVITLVEAVNLLTQQGLAVRCALVGETLWKDQAYLKHLRERVGELGLRDAVQFVGPVLRQETVHWYRRCFAHVSCVPPDNALDKAPLEAMACGKLSLSSALAYREVMGQSAEWLTFCHGAPSDLANKIQRLMQLERAQQESIGAQLRQNVIQGHSLDGLVSRLMSLFRQVRKV